MSLSNALKPFAMYEGREISAKTLVIFLAIAESGPDGVLQADLVRKLQLDKSSVSRNCLLLAAQTEKGTMGMKLIDKKAAPTNASINLLKLTPEGQSLYSSMLEKL
jgi:DNA-binding MarR family transcriptional regulator